MRYLFYLFILSAGVCATDYSNMFITDEVTNPYSEEAEADPKAEKKRKEASAGSVVKNAVLVKTTDVIYQLQYGFESQEGYQKKGNALIFSAVKSIPDFFETAKGSFLQADLLYTTTEMKTLSGVTKEYIAFTGFAGYAFDINEKTLLSVRAGASFVSGVGKFEEAYAFGFKRALVQKEYKLLADWLTVGQMRVLSLGLEFSF